MSALSILHALGLCISWFVGWIVHKTPGVSVVSKSSFNYSIDPGRPFV